MRLVAQRVSSARVTVGGDVVGEIAQGLCVLVGVAGSDAMSDADRLAEKIVVLRIFSRPGESGFGGRLESSLIDIDGSMLVVSQFTLYADCKKGRRPSFTDAAAPGLGMELYGRFVERVRALGVNVNTGVFGADMRVEIVGEGPVTIILDSAEI
ncbi:MAG: D-tyrosyl-tRNA(Tyr) deacylase [Synergistaceae bacterium]|jgi:D-tyrosyl-tRNA(Tyr) deacylase|nr:D-tyrosyl-tRNA(Tyr) deacylase [Synergistaceae bacterium]